jgi:sugar lactone lactonase YvrE
MARELTVLTDRVVTTEAPRWRDGRLWFSDFTDGNIKSVSMAGDVRVELHGGDDRAPSGLGWTPDGDLLFVQMGAGRVRRRATDGTVTTHAELHGVSPWAWNDMVVDREGRAYVGNFGFDFDAAAREHGMNGVTGLCPPTALALVQPDGAVSIAAEGLKFPNGMVITPDEKTLIVAETFAPCLTAFDIGPGGALSNRREWAPLGERLPDGICLDTEGAVWIANPGGRDVARIAEGGRVLEAIPTGLAPLACMLGGDDGRTLFIMATPWGEGGGGRILTARVDAPHAGLP